jgi:hypothetical protein
MNVKMSKLIFALHWVVAFTGHIFLIIMPIGLFRLLFNNETLDFWVKGFLLGVMYMGMIYTVNHVSNSQGFCVLTDLENFYREKEGLPQAPKRFVPRFYSSCAALWKKLKCKVSNEKN